MGNGSARIDPEVLLAEASWVRELARSLVSSSEVDDVVQETWRVALERPPRLDASNSNLRGWLATVLRNLARRSQRAERAKLDHAAVTKRESPSSDEAGHERVLLQRQLADAVLALDEPYKSAIVLRYFDELSPKEIAERQTVSYDTARQRLSRGLAMLRTKLDRDYGGDRSAWSVVCLGLAARKSALATPFVAGGTAVSMKSVSVVAAVALFAVLSVWWWRTTNAGPSNVGELTAKPTAELESPASSFKSANQVAGDARTAAPTIPAAQSIDRDRDLHGIVLDPNGKPVAGANVEVLHNEFCEQILLDLDHAWQQHSVAKSVSNSTGEFAFPLPLGRAFDLHVTANGFAAAEIEHCHAGERVEVHLTTGSTVRGRVLRKRDRTPIAGARIVMWPRPQKKLEESAPPRTTSSDDSGAYSFDGVVAGKIALGFNSPDAARLLRELEVREPQGLEFDALLDEGVTLRGRVVDGATDLPIADATIGEGWTFDRTVRTRADGEFEFPNYSADGYPEIAVRARGYGQIEADLRDKPNAPLRLRVDVRMWRSHSVRGRVVDGDGHALRDVYVAAFAYEYRSLGAGLDCVNTRTDEDGRFELDDVRRDQTKHVLWLKCEGFGTSAYVFPQPEFSKDTIEFGDLRLLAAGALRGAIVDEQGQPVPRYAIALHGSNRDLEAFGSAKQYAIDGITQKKEVIFDPNEILLDTYLARRTTRTDDLGRFSFADLAAGSYSLQASGTRGFRDVSLDVSIETAEKLDGLKLVMTHGVSIEGRVVDSDGAPVEAAVRCAASGCSDASSRTDAQGHFVVAGLANCVYTVEVDPLARSDDDAKHPIWMRATKDGIAAGTTDLVIVVPRGALLGGSVLDAKGDPATKVRVVARASRDGAERPSELDEAGHFEFWLADDQTYDIFARPLVPDPRFAAVPLVDPRFAGRTMVDPDPKHAVEVLGVKLGGAPLVIRMP